MAEHGGWPRAARPALLLVLGALLAGGVVKAARYTLARRFEAKKRALSATYAPYDPAADPQRDVHAALAKTRGSARRTLVVLGGNWCPWCLALEDLQHTEPAFARWLAERFELVHVDSAGGRALERAWGEPSRRGVPALVVLGRGASEFRVLNPDSCRVLGAWVLAYDPRCVRAALTKALEGG
jgi:Thioredoxin-like